MNFTKLQSAGNDFALFETGDMKRDWSRMATTLCDRHFGIGADGLLLLLPSRVADFQMRIFNPDGSEAEACGNGLRCLVKYVVDKGLTVSTEAKEMTVETKAGIRKAKIDKTIGEPVQIQVSMGVPSLKAEDIPVKIDKNDRDLVDIKSMLGYTITIGSKRLFLNFVSMGNPHAIYFCDQPVTEIPLITIGPQIERHEIFPNRVNFEVARVINRQQIEARVWERGAGETLACGTGACAVAVLARLRGFIDSEVDINLPGGVLNVEWDGIGEVFLGGPVEIVFTGEYSGTSHL